MAFDARKITEEHVVKAVEKIKSKNIDLINSTRWLVKIEDQYYPPKEIMRYARQEYDGSDTWGYGGGRFAYTLVTLPTIFSVSSSVYLYLVRI